MTIAATESSTGVRHGFDYTKTVLYVFAAVLVMLIVLPMSWLVYYSFVNKDGAFTLGNFATLFSDPTLLEPFVTTFILATTVSMICCAVAAPIGWLVARNQTVFIRRSSRSSAAEVRDRLVGSLSCGRRASTHSARGSPPPRRR